MNKMHRTIRILVAILLVGKGYSQDEFLNQDLLRLHQYPVSNGQVDASTNHNAKFLQREPTSQVNSVSTQYQFADDNEYSRARRNRKVYRIKNPFQDKEEGKSLQDLNSSQDIGTAASNQYSALQYSLPPEEFLQQLKTENQYQQQYQKQQFSTQDSASPYTATPQPQYQYSTLPVSNYDVNPEINAISTIEPKSYTPVYQSNTNSFQYNNQNSYNLDNIHSTVIPPYLSTAIPNNQYLPTSANTYVSTSSAMYLSSPQSSQQYVSPFSNVYSGSLDFNNKVTTVGTNSLGYETNKDVNKRMQIDHYDNAANGIQYLINTHNQYQNNIPSTTTSPTSSPYTESPSNWQNSLITGYNTLSKPEQSYSQTQYQNYRYNQRDSRYNGDSNSNDNHRIGSTPAANSLFLNAVQPDYQFLNNLKDIAKESKSDLGQSDEYSNGDYGWKLSDKKSSVEPDISTNTNYFKYQIHSVQPDTGAVSQVSFQMDTERPYNFNQHTKPVTEKLDAEEFSKAAAKAHDRYKQQMETNKYLANAQSNSNSLSNNYAFNSYQNNDIQRSKLYTDNINSHGQKQSEFSTSPFYYMTSKDASDNTHKQSFDHDKALKNIVPIDLSNVLQSSNTQLKFQSDSNNRYNFPQIIKDHLEQSLKSYSRPDSSINDRETLYSFNFKSKPDNSDKIKTFEQNSPFYSKSQITQPYYNYGTNSGNKRYVDESPQPTNFANQISNEDTQTNIYQHGMQRPQYLSNINTMLKFNDVPYRLSQNLQNNNFDQKNIPTPLPIRINQNVNDHNIDYAAEILAKLMGNKPNIIRPEMNSQSNNFLSTINGFKVANPFNLDLKLVADMLKGKPAVDNSHMTSIREDLNKVSQMKLDIAQLQQLLQLKNDNNILASNNGFNTYLDIYNNGRQPYQGVKYSRSEEDTENIPIADSSNNHPIGAVIEEDAVNEQDFSGLTENEEASISLNSEDDRPKRMFSSNHRVLGNRHRQLSNTYLGRLSYKQKYPKLENNEPYPLLKPPPPRNARYRGPYLKEKNSHQRRVNKRKIHRLLKTEPLFDSSVGDIKYSNNVKRSLTEAEDKTDVEDDVEST